MSIKISNAVFCRYQFCSAADGTLYSESWATGGRCPFCSQRVARVKDHIRVPTAPRMVERTAVVTTYRADGSAREVTA